MYNVSISSDKRRWLPPFRKAYAAKSVLSMDTGATNARGSARFWYAHRALKFLRRI